MICWNCYWHWHFYIELILTSLNINAIFLLSLNCHRYFCILCFILTYCILCSILIYSRTFAKNYYAKIIYPQFIIFITHSFFNYLMTPLVFICEMVLSSKVVHIILNWRLFLRKTWNPVAVLKNSVFLLIYASQRSNSGVKERGAKCWISVTFHC